MTRTPLLTVEDLAVGYRTGAGFVPAVEGLSFDVAAGETVAIVGESGSGKTTAAHAVIGLLPESAQLTGGRIDFAGTMLSRASQGTLRRIRGTGIGFVPQDPGTSLNPLKRIGEQIGESLLAHRLETKRTVRAAVIDLLDQVGIDRPALRAQQYPHEISGGMQQRVLIAIALACAPKLIIADEPTSALDVTVQKRVLDSFESLTRARGTAVVLVTHDLGVAADRADRVLVMERGRLVESGPSSRIIAVPTAEYTRRLLAAAPSLHQGRLAPATGGFATAGDRSPVVDTPLLELRNVRKEFRTNVPGHGRQTTTAVVGTSFSLNRGETVAIVGESGSGKSTTARLVLRLDDPTSGTIHVDGTDITRLRGEALRRARARMQLVYQNPFSSLDPSWTVERIVAEPLVAFRTADGPERARRVAALIDRVALPAGTARRRVGELSGGQRQRVAIARAIALNPALLVLDEPVSALDVSIQAQILQLLVDLQAEHSLSYLFISHDLAVVRRISDRVLVMRRGEIVEHGETAHLFENPRHEYTRTLIDAIPGRRFAAADRSVGASLTS